MWQAPMQLPRTLIQSCFSGVDFIYVSRDCGSVDGQRVGVPSIVCLFLGLFEVMGMTSLGTYSPSAKRSKQSHTIEQILTMHKSLVI